MELEIKAILLKVASIHLKKVGLGSAASEDSSFLDEWCVQATALLKTKSTEDFWTTCHKFRFKNEFVQPVKRFTSTLMPPESQDKEIHYAAQCILRKVFESILLLKNNLQPDRTEPTPDHHQQHTSTTDAAHRYYLGFILLQLCKKFGAAPFKHFRITNPTMCSPTTNDSLWWTSNINRGGLVLCTEEFYTLFQHVLSIEDNYFLANNKNTKNLMNLIKSNLVIRQKWEAMPWHESNARPNVKEDSFKEAIRLHVGGRSRAFVKFVQDNHKNKNRIARGKKPLRKELATLQSK